MRETIDEFLSDWLDDNESNSAGDNNAVVERSSETVAELLLIHGLLMDAAEDGVHDVRRITDVMRRIDDNSAPAEAVVSVAKKPRRTILAGIALTVACVLIAIGVLRPNPVTANEALEAIIEAVTHPVDRTYRLTVIEEYSDDRASRGPTRESRRRVRFEDELNGAMLHVGGVDRFVFVRELTDGRKRVSGCDGKQSWAFREDSPVHVSSRLQRYRGGLPGQQHNLGFTDLHSQLTTLREGYVVALSPIEDDQSQQELHRLTGEHRVKGIGGPKRMQIDFDAKTGTIHRMLLDGLPGGRGGPKSVEFVLVSQEDVSDEFYSHTSHHEADRRVKSE